MRTERDERKDAVQQADAAVEQVLTALGSVKTPEGLEARISQGLERRVAAAETLEFRWRDVMAGSAVGGSWWRGAVCGVAASMVVVGLVLAAGHFVRRAGVDDRERGQVAVREGGGVASGVTMNAAGNVARTGPCAGAGGVRVERVAASKESSQQDGERQGSVRLVAGSTPRWQSVPEPPLTREERELVRVARRGDVNELASLNPEIRERLDAEDAAQFQRFFAEPVVKVAPAEPVVAAVDAVAAPAETIAAPAVTETPEVPVVVENQ